ncbi:MAG: Crp/Fnr family transcriptional regulator [Paracoccaceae bacterium]
MIDLADATGAQNRATTSQRRRDFIQSLRELPGCVVSERSYTRGDHVRGTVINGSVHVQIVRSGMLSASATMQDGRRQIMCFLLPGDVVCPFELAETECRAEALTDSETFDVTLPLNGPERPAVMSLLFELSHKQLEKTLGHVVRLGRFSGAERICAFLLDLAHRSGQANHETARLTLPMSREDIADHLGLNTETVSRIISRIKRDGLVTFHSPTEVEIPSLRDLAAQVPMRGLQVQ